MYLITTNHLSFWTHTFFNFIFLCRIMISASVKRMGRVWPTVGSKKCWHVHNDEPRIFQGDCIKLFEMPWTYCDGQIGLSTGYEWLAWSKQVLALIGTRKKCLSCTCLMLLYTVPALLNKMSGHRRTKKAVCCFNASQSVFHFYLKILCFNASQSVFHFYLKILSSVV